MQSLIALRCCYISVGLAGVSHGIHRNTLNLFMIYEL